MGSQQQIRFTPPGLSVESVLQMVAFYRRDDVWKLDAIGQGYRDGLAAFATAHGIAVDDPGSATPRQAPQSSPPLAAPGPRPVDMRKVRVVLDKNSPTKTAQIDLRKSRGETGWVLTVGLEWDGRGARYTPTGQVQRYGEGDLDVYFFCRNELTHDYVIISGEYGHQGNLDTWPFIRHGGDSTQPGQNGRPAIEQVQVRPNENGDLLVNVYQSIDNGTGAINTFGRPRLAIRYGRAGRNGQPGPDSDEILIHPGNGRNSYWATVAHIDVQDGILTVDGQTRYSRAGSEHMPGLTKTGKYLREPDGGPVGRSKSRSGQGLDRYSGKCL